ncbi:unnamed protein product [Sphacelaria rigidula]
MTPAGRRRLSKTYLFNQILLLLQFAVLLALFLKPLVVIGKVHNRSAMVVYRRVFVRNVVCTVVMMLVLLATTILGYAAVNPASGTRRIEHANDISFMLHVLSTLYITEVSAMCTRMLYLQRLIRIRWVPLHPA